MHPPPPALFLLAAQAIDAGDVDALRQLLDRAPELVRQRTAPPRNATLQHHSSFNGIEELSHAAPAGAPDVARLLLERGAAVDALMFDGSQGTALCGALSSWFACVGGVQNALVAWLLDVGVDPNASVSRGQSALHFAAYQGHAGVVATLLGAGVRADAIERQFQHTPAEWAEETDEHGLSALIQGGLR